MKISKQVSIGHDLIAWVEKAIVSPAINAAISKDHLERFIGDRRIDFDDDFAQWKYKAKISVNGEDVIIQVSFYDKDLTDEEIKKKTDNLLGLIWNGVAIENPDDDFDIFNDCGL